MSEAEMAEGAMARSQVTQGYPSLASGFNVIQGIPLSHQRWWARAVRGSPEEWALGFTLSLSTVQLS